MNDVNSKIKDIEAQLKNALIEKMIVDGLIKKILLGENEVIENLGFEELFQREADIPDEDTYSLLERIQRELKRA